MGGLFKTNCFIVSSKFISTGQDLSFKQDLLITVNLAKFDSLLNSFD